MPFLEKLRSDELLTPRVSKLNNWCSVVCIVSAVWAVARCEIAPLRPSLTDWWTRWCLQMTGTLALAGFVFEVSFVSAMHCMGMTSLYSGKGAPLHGLRCAKKMIFLFTVLSTMYHIMAFDKGWVHVNWIAERMGYPGVPVYSVRYIEWTFCAPILLSVSGTLDSGPDGKPRNGLLPSALLTGIYCLNSWLGIVVMEPWTAWWNIFISFVAYFLAAWEQLAFAWYIRKQGRSGTIRSVLLTYLVIMLGIYGYAYIAAILGWWSGELEQKFYSCGDASFKIFQSAVLLVTRQMEDMGVVDELRCSATTVAGDLKRLITTASVPIFGIDKAGRVNEWNQKMAELTGVPSERAWGRALFDMFQGPCREEGEKVFRGSLNGAQTTNCELRIKALDAEGSARQATLVVSASPRRDAHGDVVGAFGVGYDLTEIKAVKEAEARKTRFMAVVSHELRSPLHGIIGLSDNLSMQETSDLRAKQLKMVKNCASRLLDLVVNIMDMAALTSGEENGKKKAPKPLACDPVSLPRIIEEVVLLVRNATDKQGHPLVQKGVQLTNEVSENVPMIEADAHKCTQVFYNIITNACKFTKKGKITVFSKADPAGQFVEVSVADTGKGIAPESRERIFEPFEQEDNSEMRQYEGIGLGLAIAKEVVQRHGGQIGVDSEVGVGSTFTVHLPVVMARQSGRRAAQKEPPKVPGEPAAIKDVAPLAAKPLAAAIPARAPEAPLVPPVRARAADFRSSRSLRSEISDGSPARRRPLVLSVDDDHVNQAVIEVALGDEYEVRMAMDGQECLDYFTNNSRLPDVLLLDVMMPGMSGFEVCKAIREDLHLSTTTLPILMLSARSPVSQSVIQALANGCNDYITKPFEKEVLVARVKTALQIKRLHEMEVQSAKDMELLFSIMPPHIIERLQAGENMIAESHESVTILFSDIVGWTNIAESLTTSQVVVLLNELFSAFDELTETYGVYKVETIGDAYMCAAGHDGSEDHAVRIARFGLAMVQACQRVRPPSAGLRLQIRVGAHTGPAYTGVVGRKVPRYCFFGDTVNVSSRMESHGTPGCIHISQSTRDALGDDTVLGAGVQILERGTVDIKGKGAMSTHLIVPPGGTVPPVSQIKRRPTVCTFNLPDGSPNPAAPDREPTPQASLALSQAQCELAARNEELHAERMVVAELHAQLEGTKTLAKKEQEALEAAKVASARERAALERAREEAVGEARSVRTELVESSRSFDKQLSVVTKELEEGTKHGRGLEERLHAATLQSLELEQHLVAANAKLAADRALEELLLAAKQELAEGEKQNRSLTERLAALEAERRQLLALAPSAATEHDRSLQERLNALEVERRALQAANGQLQKRLAELPHKEWTSPDSESPSVEAAPDSKEPTPSVSWFTGATQVRAAGLAKGLDAAPGNLVSLARLLEAKEQQVRHLRLELKMKDQKLQATRASLASTVDDSEAKDAELQHALIDLRAALMR